MLCETYEKIKRRRNEGKEDESREGMKIQGYEDPYLHYTSLLSY